MYLIYNTLFGKQSTLPHNKNRTLTRSSTKGLTAAQLRDAATAVGIDSLPSTAEEAQERVDALETSLSAKQMESTMPPITQQQVEQLLQQQNLMQQELAQLREEHNNTKSELHIARQQAADAAAAAVAVAVQAQAGAKRAASEDAGSSSDEDDAEMEDGQVQKEELPAFGVQHAARRESPTVRFAKTVEGQQQPTQRTFADALAGAAGLAGMAGTSAADREQPLKEHLHAWAHQPFVQKYVCCFEAPGLTNSAAMFINHELAKGSHPLLTTPELKRLYEGIAEWKLSRPTPDFLAPILNQAGGGIHKNNGGGGGGNNRPSQGKGGNKRGNRGGKPKKRDAHGGRKKGDAAQLQAELQAVFQKYHSK
ncbi:hypothetical protein PLESTM_000111500 [Pleodorina starrii]|nr:hypothetical protein PLESTM_000111500 [Pleodorina starrii]